MSKRRHGFPSEARVKRGERSVRGGEVELIERLGNNDPCPCGSGRRFQELLPERRWLLTAQGAVITCATNAPPRPTAAAATGVSRRHAGRAVAARGGCCVITVRTTVVGDYRRKVPDLGRSSQFRVVLRPFVGRWPTAVELCNSHRDDQQSGATQYHADTTLPGEPSFDGG